MKPRPMAYQKAAQVSRRASTIVDVDDYGSITGGKDGAAAMALSVYFELREMAWNRELEQKIAMGWGNVDTKDIPKNWRTTRGPERKIHENTRRGSAVAQLKRIAEGKHPFCKGARA